VPYLGKRLLALVPVLLAISFLTFLLIALIPGDPAVVMLGADASKDALDALRISLGLDRPFPVRFFWWLVNALKGDLGVSLYQKRDVAQMVLERVPTTVTLCLFAMAISVVIGVPSGVISAVKRNSLIDHTVRIFGLIGFSIPNFWFGLLLILLFSVKWPLFPMTGFVGLGQDLTRSLMFFALPSLALGMSLAGFLSRLTRSIMLDTLALDYIRTARSKGLRERTVVYRHALRSGLLPLVTVIGLNFGVLLGGSVVIETVFSLPGVGRLMVFAVSQRDFPVVQGAILYVALFYTLVNLVTDLSYAYLDPRVRYS
jgi:peptide/nickel transport system permease protein